MQGLEGVRILEMGNLVSASYASKLLADLGADVVKIEPLNGDEARRRGPFPGHHPDPEKSGLFLYLNTNKRSITLDPVADRAAFLGAIAWADLLIHNFTPRQIDELGLDFPALTAHNPHLVVCAITPFGLTGPHRDYEACELTIAHGGGWAWLSPNGADDPALPPLKAAGHQCDFQVGAAAATVAATALYRAVSTGVGELIDLSAQAYIASILEQNFVHYTYAGNIATRLGRRLLYPWGTFQCKDGPIFLIIGEEAQWRRLVELMGNPEWAEWEIFKDGYSRSENSDVLRMYMEEWMANWNVADLFREGQTNRICFAPASTMADLPGQPQLKSRGYLHEVTHPKAGRVSHLGAPYQLHESWWKLRQPAALLGQHNDEVRRSIAYPLAANPASGRAASATSRPLDGIRVLDFSWVWAGPFCTMQLAHLGAEVIKIESRERPDIGRRLPIYPKGMEGNLDRCGYYNQWHQGKKSVQLNFAHPEARAIAKELAATADVIVDNFATGVMDEFGLGHEELRRLKPDLIVASITGYGHTGPQKDYMGYGPAIVMISGLASLTGYQDGPPREVGISLGDPNGGIHAAFAICASLLASRRTGRGGQSIDLSLWEAMAALLPEGWMEFAMNGKPPPRIGNRDPLMAPHNCYRCAGDDEWVSIACRTDQEFAELSRIIGHPELATTDRFRTANERKAHEDELDAIISAWTATRSKFDVTTVLQAARIPAFPSMNSKDLAEDPQLNERGFFARLPHPAVGTQTHAGIPWLLTNSPNGVRTAAPTLGQHTNEVLRELLHYSEDKIARLMRDGILT
jgi:crotonobetainyl-CoA:carnitine CoA-transferase CaiB-like acyl-CoA transferase